MIVKIHNRDGNVLIAICDSELLGKKFSEGNKQLDLTSTFYKGTEVDEKKLKEDIKRAYILNIVGKKSINFALKEGIIQKEHIITIQDIPHAQALLLR